MTDLVNILALEPPVQAAIATSAATVVVALIGVALELLRRSHKKLGAVRDQVENSHGTNLRDDIDHVIAAVSRIEEMQKFHTGAIAGMREEMRQQRVEHHDLEKQVHRLAGR